MNDADLREIVDLFAGVLAEIVSKISGFSLDELSAEPDDCFGEIVSFMSLGGQGGGTLFISADEPDMRAICAAMTGVPRAEVTREDACDTLCELVNMTAGNAKLRLGRPDLTYALTSPLLITGDRMSIAARKRVRVISRRLGDGEIALRVKIVC